MNIPDDKCLVCGRRSKPTWDGNYWFSCERCGRYGVTHLGRVTLTWKEGQKSWSRTERAQLLGLIRECCIRGDAPHFFEYQKADPGQILVHDFIRDAPGTLGEQESRTLLNLSRLCQAERFQWNQFRQDADLSVAFAVNVDELEGVLRGLAEQGFLKYELNRTAEGGWWGNTVNPDSDVCWNG